MMFGAIQKLYVQTVHDGSPLLQRRLLVGFNRTLRLFKGLRLLVKLGGVWLGGRAEDLADVGWVMPMELFWLDLLGI